MPVYTYRCENCGIQFEQTQKFTDQSLTRCPECGKKSLRKVFQPVGIVFKGSGFYATDHRSPSGGGKFASHNNENHDHEHEHDHGEGKPAESKVTKESGSESSSESSSKSKSSDSSSSGEKRD